MRTLKRFAAALAAGVLMILATAVPALAQDPYGGGEPDDVQGVIIVKENPSDVERDDTVVRGSSTAPGPAVLPSSETAVLPSSDSGVLPFTGGDLLAFVTVGGAAVIVGSALVRRARER